jgi:hypothetical protein
MAAQAASKGLRRGCPEFRGIRWRPASLSRSGQWSHLGHESLGTPGHPSDLQEAISCQNPQVSGLHSTRRHQPSRLRGEFKSPSDTWLKVQRDLQRSWSERVWFPRGGSTRRASGGTPRSWPASSATAAPWRGPTTSWNVRDGHMADTLDRLAAFRGGGIQGDRAGVRTLGRHTRKGRGSGSFGQRAPAFSALKPEIRAPARSAPGGRRR